MRRVAVDSRWIPDEKSGEAGRGRDEFRLANKKLSR
jgi:hypothetical protein